MANLNKVMLIGNLTRDPEVRYTPKGTAVTDIGMAINRTFTLDGGERKDETVFVDVTFWGKQAETIGQYMKKGRSLYVEGRLNLDSWDDKNSGQKRTKLKVIGEQFQFIGSKPDHQPEHPATPAESHSTGSRLVPGDPQYNDDGPF